MTAIAEKVNKNTLSELVKQAQSMDLEPESPSITSWAADNRYLPAGTTERPGLWRPDFMPYLVEIQDNFHPDSPIRVVSIMKSTQSGASTTAENIIGHSIKHALHNILYVISDVQMMQFRSRAAIDVMIDMSGLADYIKPITKREGQRKTGDTVLWKEFSGGRRMLMTSYNSIAKLKSFSWDLIFLDEIVEAPFELTDQGDPEAIIEARGKTIRDLKICKLSTPTAAGNDRIARAFKSADQREYMIPCPRCGGYQWLEFMHKKDYGLYGDYEFDKRGKGSLVPGSERYKCKYCGGDFYEHEKAAFMLEKSLGGQAFWEPQAVSQDGRDRSYHISAMMSPMTEWKNIVTDYLKADMGKNLQEYRNFIITNEGLHPETDRRLVLWDELRARAEAYPAGQVPEGPLIITGGADIHKNRIELVLTAWGPGMEAWIFDHQVFFGATADIRGKVWDNLFAFCDRGYIIPSLKNIELNIAMVGVDISYNPSADQSISEELRSEMNAALVFCSQHPGLFTAIKGIEEGKSKGVTLTQRKHNTIDTVFYLCDVGAIKDIIFSPDNIDSAEGKNAIHFSQDFPEEFFRQFASEFYGEDERGRLGWWKLQARNETLDCYVYSRAAAMILGYDKYDDDEWLNFQDALIAE